MPTHQRKTPRAQRYDYTSPGGYFITICTKDREHYFGEIENGEMQLHPLGQYASDHRDHISDHYPFVECHAFICMPNHIHGILIIGDTVGTQFLASSDKEGSIPPTTSLGIRTYKNTSLPSKQSFIPASGSLGAIIRGYKIGITTYAKQHNIPFARQGRYHDHIIRDEQEYEKIKYYIQTNPENRHNDKFHE